MAGGTLSDKVKRLLEEFFELSYKEQLEFYDEIFNEWVIKGT